MNDLLGRLHSALARQRALVADASHELRTPFAVLRGELELAGKPGRSRDELAAAVASAADEAGRLNRITDDLLLLARSDEDRLTVQVEDARIRDLLAGSAERAGPRAAAAGVSLVVDARAELTARVDPGRIRQAVDNLVDNALRFAPAGTAIGITAGLRATTLSSRSPTPVRGFRPATWRTPSSGSAAPTAAGPVPVAVPASGSRSCRPSRRRTAARQPRQTGRAVAPACCSGCRMPSGTLASLPNGRTPRQRVPAAGPPRRQPASGPWQAAQAARPTTTACASRCPRPRTSAPREHRRTTSRYLIRACWAGCIRSPLWLSPPGAGPAHERPRTGSRSGHR